MIVHLNYLSDFIIKERFKTSGGDLIAIPDECDLTLTYRTSPYAEYVASRINGVYTNCAPTNGGALLVMFNEHGLDRGSLTRTAEFDLHNSVVPDGFLSVVSPESTSIELWSHESEIHGVVDCDALLNYVKGDEGKPPIFESGMIESGNPNTAPLLRLVFTGYNADGNPLYTITGSLPKGDGLHIAGYYETLDELTSAYPAGDKGMYIVGDGDLYGWDIVLAAWEFAGHIKGDKGDTGFTPVIEVGDIATGAAGSAASLTLTPNGVDAGGNPIYQLGGSIPQGATGLSEGKWHDLTLKSIVPQGQGITVPILRYKKIGNNMILLQFRVEIPRTANSSSEILVSFEEFIFAGDGTEEPFSTIAGMSDYISQDSLYLQRFFGYATLNYIMLYRDENTPFEAGVSATMLIPCADDSDAIF